MIELPPDARLTDRLLLWADRNRRVIFGAIVLTYLAGYNGQWRVNSDSALYAAIARNVATGNGYTYLGELDRIVEPGLPWTIALGFRMFGVDNFVLPTLLTLATTLGALALVYRLFRLHTDRPTAVVVLLLTALCERVHRYAYELFTDAPFFFGVMLTLVGYERLVRDRSTDPTEAPDEDPTRGGHRSVLPWAALVAGLVVMNVYRATALTFMGALAATIMWHLARRRQVWRHLLIAAVAVVVVLGLRLIDPRRQYVDQPIAREAMLGSMLTERLGWVAHRTFFDFVPMLTGETAIEAVLSYRIAPGVNHLFCLGIVAIGVWLGLRHRSLWGVWIFATLAQMLVWLPRERYFLPILPLLMFGIWHAIVRLNRRYDGRRSNVAVAVALVLLVVPNLVNVVRYVAGQRRVPFHVHHDKGYVPALAALAQRLASATEASDLIVAEQDRELSYFSGRTVIAPIDARRVPPTPRELDALRARFTAAPRLLVLVPGEKTQMLIDRLDLQLGETLFELDGKALRRATVHDRPSTR